MVHYLVCVAVSLSLLVLVATMVAVGMMHGLLLLSEYMNCLRESEYRRKKLRKSIKQDKPSTPLEFHFNDKIRVTSGFYTGMNGRVVDKFTSGDKYMVKLSGFGCEGILPKDMEKL